MVEASRLGRFTVFERKTFLLRRSLNARSPITRCLFNPYHVINNQTGIVNTPNDFDNTRNAVHNVHSFLVQIALVTTRMPRLRRREDNYTNVKAGPKTDRSE